MPLSRFRRSEPWAEWVAWVLEDAGHRVILDIWDFGPGSHFVGEIDDALRRSARMVMLVSRAYLSSVVASREWQAVWAVDPGGDRRLLVPFRIEDCPREGLLRQLDTVDLFDLERDEARRRLVAALTVERPKPATEPPFPAPGSEPAFPRPPSMWNVPWPRNPNFTGRADELDDLRSRLLSGAPTAVVSPQALYGLGGVGKTHMAVEYAYRYSVDYDLVWWVPADDPGLSTAALAALAERMGVAEQGAAEKSAAAAAETLRLRERFPRWLVIIDNAGAPANPSGLMSAAGAGGHVLVTSQDPNWSAVARAVEIDVLPPEDAVALLQARVPRLTDDDAHRIAEELGRLPLALEQAGTWLSRTGMSSAEFCDAVRDRAETILAKGTPAGYPVPVAATWSLAVDRLADPSTELLLKVFAFLGPEPIPTDLVASGEPLDGPAGWARLDADPIARAGAVGHLTDAGLVRLGAPGTIVMHRLVQTLLRARTPTQEVGPIQALARGLLARACRGDAADPASWPRYAQVYPHALAVYELDGGRAEDAELIGKLGAYLRASGDYASALALGRRARQRWLDQGEDHPYAVAANEAVANSLWLLGRHAEARAVQQDVLERRRRVGGDDDPQTIKAASNLAVTTRHMGDFAEARSLQEDVLDRSRRILAEDHPETFTAAANLASTLWEQGDYPAARKIEEQVLAWRRESLGKDAPRTIMAASNLAATLMSLGEFADARAIQEDVLTRSKRVLGENHPDTLASASNLAGTLWELEDYEGARVILDDVHTRTRQELGDDHPDTLNAAANLAATLRSLGRLTDARSIEEDMLRQRQRLLGEDHPSTLMSLSNLAATLRSLGDPRARALQEEVVARRTRILGADHPVTRKSRDTLDRWEAEDTEI